MGDVCDAVDTFFPGVGSAASGIFGGPQPPDLGPYAAASEKAAQLAYDSAQQDLAFRQQVYQDSLPRQQQLQQLATQVAQQQLGISGANEQRAAEQWNLYQNIYQPLERQVATDAMGGQFLTPEERRQLQADPSLAGQFSQLAADRQAQEQVSGIRGATGQNVAQLQGLRDQGLAGIQGLRDQELQFLAGREARDRAGVRAGINNAYGQQARNFSRFGGDSNRLAAMSGQIANQQALASVGGMNQLSRSYGELTHGVRQGAGQQALALQQGYGREQLGMEAGSRDQERQVMANRYLQGAGLRAGAASFGRNMPNTAAQAYGMSGQAGNAAVTNQQAGFSSALPYAQFQSGAYGTGLGAAGIGGQQALGLGNLATNVYGSQAQVAAGNMAGLGQLAGMGLWYASDRRLKSDIVRVGTHPLGVGIYKYTLDGVRQTGVMADEVEKVRPEAVMVGEDGYKRVNYGGLS